MNSVKKFSQNLFVLGLLLVAIPCFVQVAFVVYLSNTLNELQERLEEQWHSEELIRRACQLCRDSTDTLVWMQMPLQLQTIFEGQRAGNQLERPWREYLALVKMASEIPEQQETLKTFVPIANTLFELQKKELEAAMNVERAYNRIPLKVRDKFWAEKRKIRAKAHMSTGDTNSYKRQLHEYGPGFIEGIAKIVSNEEVRQAASDKFGAASIASLNSKLSLFALVTIAMTLLLGSLYAVSIRRPLRRLSENARLLSQREKLLPAMTNAGAFGKLDQLLHLTAAGVESALLKEREVFENAADLICIIDENSNFISINPFVERMLGYQPADLVGQPVNVLAQVEQSLLIDEYIRDAIKARELKRFDIRLQSANGKIIETRWSCIWSESQHRLFCVAHDVTEDKVIEVLKQDFADMISHDLRSPLMAMSHALTLIEKGVKGPISENARLSVEASSKNVEKLIALVNDLLDFQKLKAGKMELKLERSCLETIVSEAAELLVETARSKSVVLCLPEGETFLECDYNKIFQTIVNLLSNAIKFSPENSQVTVNVNLVRAGQKDNFESLVRLSVRDSGPGVPEDFRVKIFEPFEQASSGREKEGTGLGLAICKLIVEAHGGKISVEPVNTLEPVERGSVFVVDLPLAAQIAGA